jgi:hypothetical protein
MPFPPLPNTANLGDPGHIADHNQIVADLASLRLRDLFDASFGALTDGASITYQASTDRFVLTTQATAGAITAGDAATLLSAQTYTNTALAKVPAIIRYGAAAVPLRTTVTSDLTRTVIWWGSPNTPSITTNGAGGTAVQDVDLLVRG